MVQSVSDSASNRNEQIENAACAIGASAHKRAVFEAIHHGKKATKTVAELSERTGLSRKQVLDAANPLVKKKVVEQTKVGKETAYTKNDFLQAHKHEVLSIAGNPHKLAKYPTKRSVHSLALKVTQIPVSIAKVEQVTIDDISSFSRVKGVTATENLPSEVSERDFKRGIQSILGEPGEFKDWGGERNDLLSTRLVLRGRRRTVAFAFKGPGTTGRLTPKKMGKNGDQIQRLFQSSADVYLIQYWREIGEEVLEQTRGLALAKSVLDNRKVWYGLVDGYDSRRIYEAYESLFSKK